MDSIIRVRELRKVYRIGNERVVALDCIDLEIERGEVCCILGTSGSGKSTLLNMLAGLEKPTRGTVLIGKNDIVKMSEKRLAALRQKNIGFVFQSYNLLQSMTAVENVALPLVFKGMGKSRRELLALRMLRAVGLGNRQNHRPSQMSGGQQQRVGIARAFGGKPKIVFADEPTGNLDTRTSDEVMELMVRMARANQQTLVIVTHDMERSRYADRVIVLKDGRIIEDRPNRSLVPKGGSESEQSEEMVIPSISDRPSMPDETQLAVEQMQFDSGAGEERRERQLSAENGTPDAGQREETDEPHGAESDRSAAAQNRPGGEESK